MKVLLQWSTRTPGDWAEVDSSEWSSLPSRPVPEGGERIDEDEGWLTALNVQGVIFQGYDHYSVEDLPDGACRVVVWNDDPEDLPTEAIGEFFAREIVFHPLAPDPRLGGAINTRQEHIVYAGPNLREYYRQNPSQLEVRSWNTFSPPAVHTIHGIWMPDALMRSHEVAQSHHGWREWGVNGTIPPQRPLGRYSVPDGTKTYGLRINALATGIHDVNAGADEFEQTLDAFGAGVGDTGQNVGGSTDVLYFVWTTLSGEPNDAAWPTGDYRCQLDISAAGEGLSYGFATAGAASGHFARVDSGLTSDLETKTQIESLFTGTGLKLATTGSVSWTAGDAGDRWECLLAVSRGANHGNESMTFTDDADSFSDGPWEAAAPGAVPERLKMGVGT